MEDQLPYRAEYAKTGRAKCKACKNPIIKGELRCAAMVQVGLFVCYGSLTVHAICIYLLQ